MREARTCSGRVAAVALSNWRGPCHLSGFLILLSASVLLQAQPLKREAHTPEDQFRFAEGLLSRKFYDMAEPEFRVFVEKFADHELAPHAMFRLIECLRNQAKASATLSHINQFQARWPDHELAPKLFLWKGELLLREKRLGPAASCFKRLVISDDSVTQEASLYFLAQCYAQQEKDALALKTYAKIADKPFDEKHVYRPYALFSLARAAQLNGEFDDAKKGFSRLKDEKHVPPAIREEAVYRLAEAMFLEQAYKEAIELYELLLVDYPDGAFGREARKRRTWAHFSLNDFAKAVELAKDWRDRYGDVFDYEMDYVHGTGLTRLGFFRESMPYFIRLGGDERVPEEYALLARYQELYCLLRLENYEETAKRAALFVSDYSKAVQIADALYFAGEALFQLKRHEEAVAELRRGLSRHVGQWAYYGDAQLRLTESLETLGRFREAARVYRTLSEHPTVEQKAYFRLKAGECERKGGDLSAAVGDFEKLLNEFPDAEEEARSAVLHLGELYSQRGDYGRAVQLLEKLLSRDRPPEKARLLFYLGYLHYQQKAHDRAVTYLREALKQEDIGAVAVNAKYFLAGSLLELGKNEEALRLFAELLTLPVDELPSFAVPLLFRIDLLYYAKNQYDVSETVCRWLLTREDREVLYRATVRLAQILMAQSRLEEAKTTLEELLTKLTDVEKTLPDRPFAREEVQSLLGEVLLLLGERDRAVGVFERCLVRAGLAEEPVTRCRWGLAQILKDEKRLVQALHYAVNAFVLSNDPTYTPRAMFLAVEVLVAQEKFDEAATTWRELRKRFPSFSEQKRTEPIILELMARDGKEKAPAPVTPDNAPKP